MTFNIYYNMPIETNYNFDGVFLRDVIVSTLAQLHNRIYWYNNWENEQRKIEVPFYYSLTGDDRFLLDSFVDDIPGKRIEQNYDRIPRGVITLESTKINSQELTNPNVRVNRVVENLEKTELKRVLSKVRSAPMTVGFEIKVRVASEIDLFKCQEAIWNLIFQYKYFYFEYKFLRIDAFFRLPDEFQTKLNRDINMTSDIYIEQSFRLDVSTYYPMFGEIEPVAPINRVHWQNNIWRLNGSGAENIPDLTKDNTYPPQSDDRGDQNRSDRLQNPNDDLP